MKCKRCMTPFIPAITEKNEIPQKYISIDCNASIKQVIYESALRESDNLFVPH